MQVWSYADQRKAGFLNRAEFFNFLKLVTVAQSKRELTPDIVKAALYSPASAKIPAPQINLAATPSAHSKAGVPAAQLSGTPPSPQNISVRGPQGLGNVSTNQQLLSSQPNQFIRPSQAMPPGTAPHPWQVLSGQGMPSGGTMAAPRPPTSNMPTGWPAGSTGSPLGGATSQVSSRGITPSTQDGFGLPPSSLTTSVQPRPAVTSGQTPATAPTPQDPDSKALVVSGNGFAPDSLFGDVFSATPVQQKQDAPTSSASSVPVSTAIVAASPKPEPSVRPSPAEPLQGAFAQQPVGVRYQQVQSAGRPNQQFAVKSTPASAGLPVGAVSSVSSQSHVPWPKLTQSEVQKYTKVFMQVDTDRDGKITGEQARNLFLSWRLPRGSP